MTEQPPPSAADRFDFDELFEADYLRFYAPYLTEEQTLDDTQLILDLLDLQPGETVLDLACGHGRIANRLARLGIPVIGIDQSAHFLEVARAEAAELTSPESVAPDYRLGDLRKLELDSSVDVAISWFTSFGYYDDATNREILKRTHAALRPGGRLLLETMNLHPMVFDDCEHSVKSAESADGTTEDFMIDAKAYDPHTGRMMYRRTVAKGEHRRHMQFFVRLFSYTELRDWLLEAGFHNVTGFGGQAEPFAVDSDRMILVAEA